MQYQLGGCFSKNWGIPTDLIWNIDYAHERRVLQGTVIFNLLCNCEVQGNLSKIAHKELIEAPVMGQILYGIKVAGSFAVAIDKQTRK